MPSTHLSRRACLAGARHLATLALALWFGGMPVPALGHDAAEWIERGGYRNAAGESCCGERDCAPLADGDVEITSAGYRIRSLSELVPFHEAAPSPDGRYWRCAWGGARKCFCAPLGTT